MATKKKSTRRKTSKSTTPNVPFRKPKANDSAGYKAFYVIVMLAVAVGVFAWRGGYLDRFLVGTPLEQYAVGTTDGGNAGTDDTTTNSGTTSGDATSEGDTTDTTDSTALGDGNADFQNIDWHWDPDESPEYYKVLGKAVIDYDIKPGTIEYAGIDDLGRTLRVNGCITYEMWEASAGWRQDFASDGNKIPGMKPNQKGTIYYPDGTTTDNIFLKNKSHLIADALGSESSRRSAICGTRTENVGSGKTGALYFENIAVEWIKNHSNSGDYLYYSAIPIYNGDELIPRATVINMKSSDGEIDMQGLRYNTMLYYNFDYYTGELTYTGK